MFHANPWASTDSALLPILEELQRREPIFHRPEFAAGVDAFARLMTPGYWEVGASGRRYSRAFILRHLTENPPADAHAAGWITSDFACRHLGEETYLVTYTLDQKGRITRRSTLWRQNGSDWQILFHQGTVVSSTGVDNVTPGP